jgi:hypothetical protein
MNIAIIGDSFPESLLLENKGYPEIVKSELDNILSDSEVTVKKYTKSGILLEDIPKLLDEDFYTRKWDYVFLHCGNFEAFPAIPSHRSKLIIKKWIAEDLRHRLKYRNKITELVFNAKQALRGKLIQKYGVKIKIEISKFSTNYEKIIKMIRHTSNKVVVVSLTRVDEELNPNFNDYLLTYNNSIKNIAKNYNLIYIDLFKFSSEDNKEFYTKDGWHWNEDGHEFFSGVFLKEVFHLNYDKRIEKKLNNKTACNKECKDRSLSFKTILRVAELLVLCIYLVLSPILFRRRK